jgi:methionyl-tRNA formyltransferase
LPYNKGAYPNFWSFVENIPSGVTICQIDCGIDNGRIIYQKQIDFELFKNKKNLTFLKTYETLINEIENLFVINIKDIINQNFNSSEQIGEGSYHNEKDLPKLLKNWEQNIYQIILKYKKLYK